MNRVFYIDNLSKKKAGTFSKGYLFLGILSLLMVLFSPGAENFASSGTEPIERSSPDHLKAAYILKFADFVEWPKESSNSKKDKILTIGIMGNQQIFEYLKKNIQNIKAAITGQEIQVIEIIEYAQVTQCRILFISESSRKKLKKILEFIGNRPILTIGESSGYSRDEIMIDLFPSNDYICFNINLNSAKKSGIVLTSKIVSRAKEIITN